LPIVHASYFAHQAALGLQHAHEKGMVHRVIKPHNLMLTHDGERRIVEILDFGLAKVTREERLDGGLTAEGQALGTPDFIAPEQIIDAPSADVRADIYSLGCSLYYLLTGQPPFRAHSLYDMFQAHISHDADRLNFVRPEVPAELAALVAKMMAKEPFRRFQTPGEVADALTPFYKRGNVAWDSPRPELSYAGGSRRDRPPELTVPVLSVQAADDRSRGVTMPEQIPPRGPDAGSAIRGRIPVAESPGEVGPTAPAQLLWRPASGPIAGAACLLGPVTLIVMIARVPTSTPRPESLTPARAVDDSHSQAEKGELIAEPEPSKHYPTTPSIAPAASSVSSPGLTPRQPTLVPPVGPERNGHISRGSDWTVDGDQLVKEGLGTGWAGFGNPEWTITI
jgi:hypothetical protein